MPKIIEIDIFVDGEESDFLDEIKQLWACRWAARYMSLGSIHFNAVVNVKEQSGFALLPGNLKRAFEIRNPDVFFIANLNGKQVSLGGIEITVHSPDGSNVEKRYPFIWAGRKHNFSAFVACPYMKSRPGGQINKLPNRHSVRNLDFITKWKEKTSATSPLHQIIPIQELQEDQKAAEALLNTQLMNWENLSNYFCDLLAESLEPKVSGNSIHEFVQNMSELATACKRVTRYTKPTSFTEDGNRWIQIYNTRPDSGHWERGEGQFDSIDGRLMFTLDEAEIRGVQKTVEFWMPQLSKHHAWVAEQVQRDHGSKRLRNIVKVLSNYMTVKFSDDLTKTDLQILQNNPGLTLERLDWKSGLLKLSELLCGSTAQKIARAGLKSPSTLALTEIEKVLNSNTTYLSTHRLYEADWEKSLRSAISSTPTGTTILAPRIPRSQMTGPSNFSNCAVFYAEECTKWQLMAIRQLHRHSFE